MNDDFDLIIDRLHSDSIKWNAFDPDVLPMWVADMDFRAPEAVIRAIADRLAHGVFGYGVHPRELQEMLAERIKGFYNWEVSPEAIIFLPGVITGFNLACRAFTQPGDALLIQTPVYPPILHAHENHHLVSQHNHLIQERNGSYSIDSDAFEAEIQSNTKLFILCNPHNPVGRVFRRAELEEMAEICLRRGVTICSDEIHCDLVFSESKHIPIASLDPEIARNTVTLMAPSKTFNIAGLDCSFAIIPGEEMRKQYLASRRGMVGEVNLLGLTAARAAYTEGQPWLNELLKYLQANRDCLLTYLEKEIPEIRVFQPEGTYLAWLDCTAIDLDQPPCEFFIQHARVAMNDGAAFGPGGEGFVRINFGCPRSQMMQALERMKLALERRQKAGY